MKQFKNVLEKKILKSYYNDFGKENYDAFRFGEYKTNEKTIREIIKNNIKRIIGYKKKEKAAAATLTVEKYIGRLEYVWNNLDASGKDLWINLIAFRILGYSKIKLPLNNNTYRDAISKVRTLKKGNDTINPHFLDFILERFDLHALGYDIELYFLDVGIVIDFIIEQYAYKVDNEYQIQAEKGDVVLDIGACWGDTALYFADKVGDKGKVFSFEFIPDNIEIYNKNISLNPSLSDRIQLIEHPVSDVSDRKIFFQSNGPGSRISDSPFNTQTGSTTTISVDDFVERNNLTKVDFIKMDIEGAEPAALQGALNTIKKFRPKLAIAIYHSMEDFVNIPKWLMDLDLGYDFYLGHYTIHAEETVIYAKPRAK
jgi:FkbM family methyltransferase